MKQAFFATLISLIFTHNGICQYNDNDYEGELVWGWDIRSVPAVGFFPLGGDPLDNISLSTFICGPSIDIFGYLVGDDKFQHRFTFVNLSAYLIGLNYAALNPQSEAQVFQIGFARIGPHYRFQGIGKHGRFALGSQLGYGALLEANTASASSKIQHGIEISFTFSWTPFIFDALD